MEWKMKRIGIDLLLILVVIILSIKINNVNQKPVLNKINLETPIFEVDKPEKEVSITFDVNWAENDYLYEILDVLDKYNVKSTFFVMGKWIIYSEENTNKLREIDKRGHEIGNHSYIHPSFSKITTEKMKEEINKTDKIINECISKKTNLFRFPSGDYNQLAVTTVSELNYIPIQWNVDSVDWKEDGLDIEYDRVVKKVKPGSIMLFHNNAKYTPKNLDKIIKNLSDKGYCFKTVGEMVYKDNYTLDKSGIQHKND